MILALLLNCYIGSNPGSPDGEALKVLACDPETGAAKIVQRVDGPAGTTYAAFDRAGEWLYSMTGDESDKSVKGKAVRFKIGKDGRIGEMQTLAGLPCPAPCHVACLSGGGIAYAAYGAATVAVVNPETGAVRSRVLSDEGTGPNPARQKKAYAHFAFETPDGSRLGVVNLGCDRIHFFDPATLEEDESMRILSDPGDGPRHAVWSKDGRFLFVVNELGNSVSSFAFDGRRFAKIGKWSTLPDGFPGESKTAAIRLTDDGRMLLASNRGHDSIAMFAVDAQSGRLERRGIAPLSGRFPRDFALMPGEKFAVVGHKLSNEIQIYRFDRETAALAPAGEAIPCWRPLCVLFPVEQ